MVILSVIAFIVVIAMVIAVFWNPAAMGVLSKNEEDPYGEPLENVEPDEQHQSKKSVE